MGRYLDLARRALEVSAEVSNCEISEKRVPKNDKIIEKPPDPEPTKPTKPEASAQASGCEKSEIRVADPYPEPLVVLDPAAFPAMPKGVKLLKYEPKAPPVAID